MTAMMMKNASIGGDPGGRWNTNTRISGADDAPEPEANAAGSDTENDRSEDDDGLKHYDAVGHDSLHGETDLLLP